VLDKPTHTQIVAVLLKMSGARIKLLDYIEGVGQPLGYYAGELRRRGWKEAIVCLRHDGVATNNITGKRYIDHWREAGFECETPIKNTGAGAAMMRVEATAFSLAAGSMRPRLKLAVTRSVITTNAAMRTAT
jgi:hypothetical protein